MKKLILLAATLLALNTGAALAQNPGVNLSWNDCTASLGTNVFVTSACNSNTEAANSLYGTFVLPPGGVPALSGNDIVIDVLSCDATVPCWWNFTVAPRTLGYSMNFDTVCPDAAGVGILDYWGTIPGGPGGGAIAQLVPARPRVIRIIGTVAVDEAKAQPVPDGVEVYSFTFRLKFDATVGTCTGCATHADIALSRIQVYQVGLPSIDLTTPSTWNVVGWQGGYPNCITDPVANKTWGAVKALYR